LYWFGRQDFGGVHNTVRDELMLRRLDYQKEIKAVHDRMQAVRGQYPQVEALRCCMAWGCTRRW
jgi:hypothetical protein